MPTDDHDIELRRYLLGELPDERTELLERQYFAHEETLDRMRAAESDLVDDYVANQLSSKERERFERHYLATPGHHRRVAVARDLQAAARAAVAPVEPRPWPAAAAEAVRRRWFLVPAFAVLLLLATATVLMVRSRNVSPVVTTGLPDQPQASRPDATDAPASAPPMVALTLSPVTVRGTDQGPILTLPLKPARVVLELEGDVSSVKLGGGRVVVRTVTGNETWRGPVERLSGTSTSLARIEIPANTLAPDDYIVVLFETDQNGNDVERYRYFLRVR